MWNIKIQHRRLTNGTPTPLGWENGPGVNTVLAWAKSEIPTLLDWASVQMICIHLGWAKKRIRTLLGLANGLKGNFTLKKLGPSKSKNICDAYIATKIKL